MAKGDDAAAQQMQYGDVSVGHLGTGSVLMAGSPGGNRMGNKKTEENIHPPPLRNGNLQCI